VNQISARNPAFDFGWYAGLAVGIGKVRLASKPVPLMVHWEISYRCNLDCSFCTTRLNPRAWSPELDTAEAIDVIDQIADLGCKILNIVGGEPTVRSDLPEILRHARSRNIRTAVTTNGVMADERREGLLEADVIRVSLEGAPAHNADLRRNPAKTDATAEAIETLRFLVKRGRKPSIATILAANTKDHDVEFLVDLCRELGITMKLTPMGILKFGDKADGFTPEEADARTRQTSHLQLPLPESLRRIDEYRRRYPDCIDRGEPEKSILSKGGLDKAGCRAMDTSMCIKADGAVALPCIEFPNEVVRSKDLAAVFYGDLAQEARRNQGNYWFCEGCDLACMMNATSLVKAKPLFDIGRRHFKEV